MTKRVRFASCLAGASILMIAAKVSGQALTSETVPVCDVTHPNGHGTASEQPSPMLHGNAGLSVSLGWTDGVVVFKPGGSGEVLPDGSLSMKCGWHRGLPGRLRIEGHRLDAPAAALRSRIPEGYGEIGFQSTAIIFPTPGCWEVTGRIQDASLTFVTSIVKVGDGPTHVVR